MNILKKIIRVHLKSDNIIAFKKRDRAFSVILNSPTQFPASVTPILSDALIIRDNN
jgi:hypothetical protein